MFATKSYELAGFSAVSADELCFVNGGSTGYSGWDGNPNAANGTGGYVQEVTDAGMKQFDTAVAAASVVVAIATGSTLTAVFGIYETGKKAIDTFTATKKANDLLKK